MNVESGQIAKEDLRETRPFSFNLRHAIKFMKLKLANQKMNILLSYYIYTLILNSLWLLMTFYASKYYL